MSPLFSQPTWGGCLLATWFQRLGPFQIEHNRFRALGTRQQQTPSAFAELSEEAVAPTLATRQNGEHGRSGSHGRRQFPSCCGVSEKDAP